MLKRHSLIKPNVLCEENAVVDEAECTEKSTVIDQAFCVWSRDSQSFIEYCVLGGVQSTGSHLRAHQGPLHSLGPQSRLHERRAGD